MVDASGSPATFQPALAAAAHFGKIILLGDTGYPSRQCLSSELMTKGLTLQATHDSHDRDGWTQRQRLCPCRGATPPGHGHTVRLERRGLNNDKVRNRGVKQ